jgi:hypothetical protein
MKKTALTLIAALALVACGGSDGDDADQVRVDTDRAEPAGIYLKLEPVVGEPKPQPAPTSIGPAPTATTPPSIPCYACLGH